MKYYKFISLFLVFILGAYVRLIDLGTHFTHVDDIELAYSILRGKKPFDINKMNVDVKEKENETGGRIGKYYSLKRALLKTVDRHPFLVPIFQRAGYLRQFVVIPFYWTNAPLQYLITTFLLRPTQSYREILFWGRFPSFIFGILGMLLIILFYRKFYKEEYFSYALTAITLLAFSWENIIYAKQMGNYAAGVTFAILLVIFLWQDLHNPDLSLKRFLLMSIPLAIASYAHYQIIFFIPAYYGTLYLFFFKKAENKLLLFKNFIISCLAYIIFASPLFLFILHVGTSKGVNWNAGPSQEFLFNIPSTGTIIGKILYAASFFGKNFIIVMQSNLSIIPEGYELSSSINLVFILLFACGIISFITTESRPRRFMMVFFLLLAMVWSFLIIRQKITLSPTRHSLILLPCMVIVISEGLGYLANKIQAKENKYFLTPTVFSSFVSVIVTVLFFLNFNSVIKERQDSFDEYEIRNILMRYNVDTIVSPDDALTSICFILKSAPAFNYFNYYKYCECNYWYLPNKDRHYQQIAFISRGGRLNTDRFDKIKININNDKSRPETFDFNLSDFDIIYSKEVTSDIEIDFSKKTKNWSRGFYFYILKRKS